MELPQLYSINNSSFKCLLARQLVILKYILTQTFLLVSAFMGIPKSLTNFLVIPFIIMAAYSLMEAIAIMEIFELKYCAYPQLPTSLVVLLSLQTSLRSVIMVVNQFNHFIFLVIAIVNSIIFHPLEV